MCIMSFLGDSFARKHLYLTNLLAGRRLLAGGCEVVARWDVR